MPRIRINYTAHSMHATRFEDVGVHALPTWSDQARLIILRPRSGGGCPRWQLLVLLAGRLVSDGQVELRLQADPLLRLGPNQWRSCHVNLQIFQVGIVILITRNLPLIFPVLVDITYAQINKPATSGLLT